VTKISHAGEVENPMKIPLKYLQNISQMIFKIYIKISCKYISKILVMYLQNSSPNLQKSFQKHQKILIHPL